jgi:uncharacterized protein YkwD
MTAWMNSAGHRANILDESGYGFSYLGVGHVTINGVEYWSQFFTTQ